MEDGTVSRTIADADELLVRIANDFALPGLAVGIVSGGDLVYARGFGLADASVGRPVTQNTVFRVGSISKTFVALALLQLWEDGAVDLDAPLSDHLDAYEFSGLPGAQAPTLRHALTHTAGVGQVRGIRDFFKTGGLLRWPPERPLPTLADYYADGLRAEVAPGERWAYANHVFGTLGQVVEDRSGQPFGSYMRERIFEPLGMTDTDFFRSNVAADRLAVGYALGRRRLKPVNYREIVIPAAGSIFSSVGDMAKYVAALLNGGSNQHGQVVKPETLSMAWEPHFVPDERINYRQGLSFMVQDYGGHRVVYHGGGWPGFMSMMMVAPEDGIGVLAFTNSNATGSWVAARSLLCRLLDVEEPTQTLPLPGVMERPDLWEELVGTYQPLPGWKTSYRPRKATGGELEVSIHGGHLSVRSFLGGLRQPTRLNPIDANDPLVFGAVGTTWGRADRVEFAFTRDVDGSIDGLNAVLTLPMRFRKVPTYRSIRTARRVLAAGAAVAAVAAARGVVRQVAKAPSGQIDR